MHRQDTFHGVSNETSLMFVDICAFLNKFGRQNYKFDLGQSQNDIQFGIGGV